MKMKNHLGHLALITAALALNLTTATAQSDGSLESPRNRALAASPRYLEKHPELLRTPPTMEESQAKAQRRIETLAKLTQNRALAKSPRFLEEHPELLRTPPTAEESLARSKRLEKQLAKLRENTAFSASPRVMEEFPALRYAATER